MNTRMRVAYVSADPGVPVFGGRGSSIHVQEVLRAMVRRAARIDLFASRVEQRGQLAEGAPPGLEMVRIHRLPRPPKNGDLAARECALLAANDDLRRALEERGPFDLVYERYSLWSFAGMEYAVDAGASGILEVNAPLIEEQALHRDLADREAAGAASQRAFTAASALAAVSDEVACYLRTANPDSARKIHVIPNAVDPSRFPSGQRPTRPAPPGVFTVGFVGTIRPWHGLPVLIEAFDRLCRCNGAPLRLLIVGEGAEKAGLIADTAARGLAHAVEFTGPVRPDEIPGLLASMDVAVAPYPPQAEFYFSPLKVQEYLAAGLPVVASRVGQLEQLIDDGENGMLCEAGNPVALANALDHLRRDPDLRNRLGAAARRAAGRNTWDAVADRIFSLAGAANGGDEFLADALMARAIAAHETERL